MQACASIQRYAKELETVLRITTQVRHMLAQFGGAALLLKARDLHTTFVALSRCVPHNAPQRDQTESLESFARHCNGLAGLVEGQGLDVWISGDPGIQMEIQMDIPKTLRFYSFTPIMCSESFRSLDLPARKA